MRSNEIKKQLEEIKTLLRKQDDRASRQAGIPLNFNQAAEYLGFSHSYLYKLTSRKIIPCHRPTGKMLFFSKAELDEWIFSQRDGKPENRDQKPTPNGGQAEDRSQNDDEDEEEPP